MALALGLMGGRAYGAVPQGYTGTPFMGTPWPLPGRIDFENYDEGAQDVVWRVDDHTGNFGIGGCAANSYRTTLPHPQLCQTNTNEGEIDNFTMGPMTGQPYPSAAMPKSIYIGYTHAVDWVKLTVNVTQAGTYKLSSTWASEPGGADGIKFQVSFNDVLKANVTLAGTGGYHNWVFYPDFATVELEAGVQVVQFAVKSMHLNYDYLQFSRVLPNGGVDDGSGSVGGGGGSGAGGASGISGAPGASGAATGGASGAAATGGAGGSASGGTGPAATAGSGVGGSETNTGTAGTTTATAGTAPASAGSAPAAPVASTADQSSGCSVASGMSGGSGLAALAALAACGGAWGRRGRRARQLKRPS